jgi:aryl-alcohol dehydrogenase-like predicted oxidoreductase
MEGIASRIFLAMSWSVTTARTSSLPRQRRQAFTSTLKVLASKSRGLLSGSPIGEGDARAHMPRFSGATGEANAKVVTGLQGLAKRWGISPSQLAIGWVLAKEPKLVHVLGMRKMKQLEEALSAKPLSTEQLAEVEAVAPRGAIAGPRYPATHMGSLDSEKR